MGIIRLIRLVISLAISGVILFYIVLFIPANLLKYYGDVYTSVHVTPFRSNNFIEWATASEIALERSKHENKVNQLLLAITFPGYRLDFHRLDQQLREENQHYATLISDLRQTFEANPALQRQWEERELGDLKGLHGTATKPTSPSEVIREEMTQGVLGKVIETVMPAVNSQNEVLTRFTNSRKQALVMGQKLQTLKSHWEEEKQIVMQSSKQLLSKAWDAILGLVNKATNSSTDMIKPADDQQPQAYR